MSNCSILRVGPIDCDGSAAAILHSAIGKHFNRDSSCTSTCASSSSSSVGNSFTNLISISNRYFDARILLSRLDESCKDVIIHGDLISNPQEDGIILIFDAYLSSSFDSLGQHHAAAMKSDRCGELLRLCVGVAHGPSPLSDGSKKSEEEYSRRVLWCLDRGYEYVEVDVTPEGMSRGFDERDKDGFARVVEAISTCMWSSHVMKRRNAGGGRVVGAGSESVHASPPVNKDVTNNESGEPLVKSEAQTASSSSNNDSTREKAAMASLMQGINEDPPETDATSKEENENSRQHQQDEMAFHQLEHVLSEAKLIREASKNNSMSDEERRERAGGTAIKLMGLLDGLGLGDYDSDEGSHSGEDEQ